MPSFAGLDVSERATHVCVVDATGDVTFQGKCKTTPEAIGALLLKRAPELERVVLETGALAAWLVHSLRASGVPVVCVCARQAHAAMQHGPVKSDRNDAHGLARLAQTNWVKPVAVRSLAAHEAKALLTAREQLVAMRRTLANQIRGLMKPFGLLLGKVAAGKLAAKVRDLTADRPGLLLALEPLLAIRERLSEQLAELDGRILATSKQDEVCRRLMSIPGVGCLTARAFMAVLDDPTRIRRSSDVGAYVGLVPRRWQSGEVDQSGHISRCGDTMLRHLLYECANVVIHVSRTPSRLKAWAEALVARIGAKKAKVALARKLAVLMHRLWVEGTVFDPTRGVEAA